MRDIVGVCQKYRYDILNVYRIYKWRIERYIPGILGNNCFVAHL